MLGRNIPSGPQTFALVVSGELPGGYIAGTVRTASGNPVSGVLMTLADGGVVSTTLTGQNGDYTVHLPSDSYIVIPSKDGWTFDPGNIVVPVGEEGVSGIDFTGSAAVGRITGTVTSAIGGRANYSLDTDHPYPDNADMTYVITAHVGTARIRVHFDEIDLQDGYDVVFVEDAEGTVVDEYSGEISDQWTSWVTGNVARIHLVSDDSTTFYGFHIDGYETDVVQQGPLSGVTVTLEPGGATAVSQPDGTFAIENLEPISYTLTPSLSHWKFLPDRRSVAVPPGGTASGQNFLGFPPGTIAGTVSAGTTSEYAEIVESEHPYPDSTLVEYPVSGPPGCSRIRVHFTQIDMEPGFDFIDILDAGDNVVDTYTGSYTDQWTPWVAGDTLKIRLQSDEGSSMYGFRMDKYAAVAGEHGIAGATVSTETGGFSAVTNSSGVFIITDVDAGPYFVSPSMPYWTFEPVSRQVNVVSGVITTDVGFYGSLSSMPGLVYIKSLADGTDVCISGKVVTAGTDDFPGCFYVEESDRTSGIKVTTSKTVHAGDVVTISGIIHTADGERYIASSGVTVSPTSGVIPDPLGLHGRALGGGRWNTHTPGVTYGVGLNNVGLLVRTWGRVLNVDAGQFYLDDGSVGGIKVNCGSIDPAMEESWVQLTAISTCELVGSDIVRVLRARKATDIITILP